MNQDQTQKALKQTKREKRFIFISYLFYAGFPLLSLMIFGIAAFAFVKATPEEWFKFTASVFAVFFTFSSICFSWKRSIIERESKEYIAVSEAAYSFFGAALFLVFASSFFLIYKYFHFNTNSILFLCLVVPITLQYVLVLYYSVMAFFHILLAIYIKTIKFPGSIKIYEPSEIQMHPEPSDLK